MYKNGAMREPLRYRSKSTFLPIYRLSLNEYQTVSGIQVFQLDTKEIIILYKMICATEPNPLRV